VIFYNSKSGEISAMKNALFTLIIFFVSIQLLSAQETPVYEWAKGFGNGLGGDYPDGITTDAAGNIITPGNFFGTVDFDPGAGVFNLTGTGLDNRDPFVLKLDADGNFVWAKSFTTNSCEIASIVTDDDGNIYLSGIFDGTMDFDPGPGVFELTSMGSFTTYSNHFTCKLDSDGNFLWAIHTPGGIGQLLSSVLVDAAQNVYILGYFQHIVDFDPGAGTVELTAFGQWDVFVLKLNASGSFAWVKQLGGTDYDFAVSLSLDAAGNIYASGVFQGTADFDPGTGTANMTSAGLRDMFICKLDPGGNFVWAKRMGEVTDDLYIRIEADATGNIYGAGVYESTLDADPGAGEFILTTTFDDFFVVKLDTDGDFVWAKSWGSDTYEDQYITLTLGSSAIYTYGHFQGTGDFDPGAGEVTLDAPDGASFISTLDTDGNFVSVAKPEANNVQARFITSDDAGNLYTTGQFDAPLDFDPDPCNVVELTSGVFFVQKLSLAAQPPPSCEEPEEDLLAIYNAISSDGNDQNEIFRIENIEMLEETKSNTVTIYNRWGDVVWKGSDYDNANIVFDGTSSDGKELPSSTYFYKIEFTSGLETKTGYLSLKR
jgi:gliding motility-associated-like protein